MTVLLALACPGNFGPVKNQTPLRNRLRCRRPGNCRHDLPAGAEVTIRFVLSGESTPCYKIATMVGGKELTGYVAASALQGLDAFDQGLREAAWVDVNQVMNAVRPAATASRAGIAGKPPALAETSGGAAWNPASPKKRCNSSSPQSGGPRDPGLLALAGAAAWRADDSGKALVYWRQSLDLQPNPALETLYQRVQKENTNDQSSARLFGVRIALRYEAGAIGVDTARQMVAVLDQEFARISAELGCVAEERIVAIAQSPEAYRKTTDAAEWSGGQFDGRIRVPVGPGQGSIADATIRRTLAHEITHACLTLTGRWPAWLQGRIAPNGYLATSGLAGASREAGRMVAARKAAQARQPRSGLVATRPGARRRSVWTIA